MNEKPEQMNNGDRKEKNESIYEPPELNKMQNKYDQKQERSLKKKKKRQEQTQKHSEPQTDHLEKKKKKRKYYEYNEATNDSEHNGIQHGNICEKKKGKKKIKKKGNEHEVKIIKKYKHTSSDEHTEEIEKNEEKENGKKKKKKTSQKETEKRKQNAKQKEGTAQIIKMNNTCQFGWFTGDNESIEPLRKSKEASKQKKVKLEMKKNEIKVGVMNNTKNEIKEDSKEKYEEKNEVDGFVESCENKRGTIADFERLVASVKNSSAVWISYIGYHIEQGNINEARKIAERALKSIDMNKTIEKLNVYLCYLNMECVYGNRLNEIFKRALIYNDEKQIYMHMIHILKRNKKLKQLKEICEEAIKKFKHSKKIWLCYLEVLHDIFKDEEAAHEVLLKSMHSLSKKKHLHMIISAARFEYKYSNKERGKVYFEKLIGEFPKRSDIWFTYLDVHISSLLKDNKNETKIDNEKKEKKKLSISDLESVRNIFERFSACKFKPRVMKMIFTKWLLFERNHGSQYHEKLVQQKAYDYVESLNTGE